MSASVDALVAYYRKVYDERMRDLPIVNDALRVEAVGFRELAEHQFGVLITPWFINLVLLPGTDRWEDRAQGSVCKIELPGGKVDFTVAHDEMLGTSLSAALFGTVQDFPDQALARDIASESLRLLFDETFAGQGSEDKKMTRRELLRRLGSIECEEQ